MKQAESINKVHMICRTSWQRKSYFQNNQKSLDSKKMCLFLKSTKSKLNPGVFSEKFEGIITKFADIFSEIFSQTLSPGNIVGEKAPVYNSITINED